MRIFTVTPPKVPSEIQTIQICTMKTNRFGGRLKGIWIKRTENFSAGFKPTVGISKEVNADGFSISRGSKKWITLDVVKNRK